MRLYEDLLDDLEKSETTAGRRIVNDIDDEHGYPGDKKYHKGMLIGIQKRQTVRRIKILKEQMADFLEANRQIDDYSMACFQDINYRYLEADNRLNILGDDVQFNVWMDFTFNINASIVSGVLKFIKKLYEALPPINSIKFYTNDNARYSIELDTKSVENIIRLYDGKKPRCGRNEKEESLYIKLLNIAMIFFPGKQSIGDECAELYKKKIDIYQHYLNYMTYTAMSYFNYKSCMIGHQSPELERKIANTRLSYKRLENVEFRYINLNKFFDYGIRNFNDRQEMDKVAIDELDANPRTIRKLEIRYVEKEEVVAFAGILQFFSIIEPGKFLNVYEATFFQTIPAYLEKEEFIKKAQVVIDDFDEDDYNFIINDLNTWKKLAEKPKKR